MIKSNSEQPSALERLIGSNKEQFIPTKRELSPLDTQVGGDHYKECKIQPVEFIHMNALDFFQGNVIKYITRHQSKNGADDIRKAMHYCQMILKLQYGVDE